MNTIYCKLLLLACISQQAQCIKAVLKSLGPCDPDTSKYLSWAEIYNITHVGNYVHTAKMSISLGRDLGETSTYTGTLYKGKKKLPLHYQGRNVCKALVTVLGDCFTTFTKQFDRPSTCPVKKGTILDRPVKFDTKEIRIQAPLKGEFSVEIVARDAATNNMTGCLVLNVELF